jgi:hypothetical protein
MELSAASRYIYGPARAVQEVAREKNTLRDRCSHLSGLVVQTAAGLRALMTAARPRLITTVASRALSLSRGAGSRSALAGHHRHPPAQRAAGLRHGLLTHKSHAQGGQICFCALALLHPDCGHGRSERWSVARGALRVRVARPQRPAHPRLRGRPRPRGPVGATDARPGAASTGCVGPLAAPPRGSWAVPPGGRVVRHPAQPGGTVPAVLARARLADRCHQGRRRAGATAWHRQQALPRGRRRGPGGALPRGIGPRLLQTGTRGNELPEQLLAQGRAGGLCGLKRTDDCLAQRRHPWGDHQALVQAQAGL